jgi:hypothetical protein
LSALRQVDAFVTMVNQRLEGYVGCL